MHNVVMAVWGLLRLISIREVNNNLALAINFFLKSNLPAIDTMQVGPRKSSVHMHDVSVPYFSMHVPPLRQVLFVQKSRSEPQFAPVKPAAQSQVVKVPGPSRHVPPLRHVSTPQNGRSTSQLVPLNP